jgi:hypothetical protein
VLDGELRPGRDAQQAIQKAGTPVSSPVKIVALIDTGASISVIQQGLAQQLAVHPVGIQHITTPSSQAVPCHQYALQLTLQATGGIKGTVAFDALFTEAPLLGQNIQCLLGRDFLAHGVFMYTGPTNSFVLSF